MNEDLERCSKELRQIADEIANMQAEVIKGQGPERLRLKEEIKLKQYQALFYMDTIENLAREIRG